jgi:hypothetical protein
MDTSKSTMTYISHTEILTPTIKLSLVIPKYMYHEAAISHTKILTSLINLSH